MELAYLPDNKQTVKTYKHFSVNSFQANVLAEESPEFFYIGKNTHHIDLMVEIFEGGYAAESALKAISIFTRIIEKKPNYKGVFIFDATLGKEELKMVSNYLASSETLAKIPLFLEATVLSDKEIAEYRKLSYIDEIITLTQCDEKLIAKVNFFSRIKDQNNHKDLQKGLHVSQKSMGFTKCYAKRTLDILISGTALAIASPIFLLIALAVKLESKGPIFYISKRAGRGYKVFNFLKFRTMEVDADKKVEQLSHLNQYNAAENKGPVFFKVTNDPRITKVGAFLRNTSLDELPQLINVLRGDMSLVGNRPLPLYEAETLTTDEWAKRFMAPAGITGLWQIKKRGQDDMSVEERIALDITYANKNSFAYDLWIMANTPSALIQKSNV